MPAAVRASVLLLVTSFVGVACGGGASPPPSAPGDGNGSGAGDAPASADAPDEPPAGPPREVDCGDFSTCAIASDGQVHCWGRDKKGELGGGAGEGQRLRRALVPGLGKVKKVALASQFACALLEDGKVKCWGTGRIANDGQAYTDAKPTIVSGVDGAEELAASGALACARGASGIACWGTDDKAIRVPPKGAFKQIAVGFAHACALDGSGAVQCWGPADWATTGAFGKPAISGAVQIVTGDRHACVITKAGGVSCWGMNDAGQLGTKPDTEPHKKPVAVAGLTGVTRLAAGEASTCALLNDGSVRCWGANGEGELGLGNRTPDERPARVTALTNVEHLCLATAHGCALTKSSKLLCWGANSYGQIGDGTKERRLAPTPVSW